uniref:Putative polyprotein n=1 Tax=Albugo laibachii Nc14 TaxID=890382 RepID=F0WRW3_9STRA|nr:putative polyprotein [Albugo laibachii Nc14]|eukprot:CCA24079.1 putative polyprotein [Albugo laibachii Nc14]
MNFFFGLPIDKLGRSGILVIVVDLSKMIHLAPVKASISADEPAVLFINIVFRHHGLRTTIVSDRDPRFTSQLDFTVFDVGSNVGNVNHCPPRDGWPDGTSQQIHGRHPSQPHFNILRVVNNSTTGRLALNNSVHSSTGVNRASHLPFLHRTTQRDLTAQNSDSFNEIQYSTSKNKNVNIRNSQLPHMSILRFIRDNVADAVDRQKQNADRSGRSNFNAFEVGDRVLLSTVDPNETDGIAHKKHHEIASSRCSLPPTTPPATPRRQLCSETNPGFARSHRIEDQTTLSSPSPLSDQNESSLAEIPRRHTKTPHRLERCDSIPARSDFSQTPPPPILDSDGTPHWIVDSLLDHSDEKTRSKSTRRYLVRWLGFAPAHDTWEPRARLFVDIPDLVIDYESRLDIHQRA